VWAWFLTFAESSLPLDAGLAIGLDVELAIGLVFSLAAVLQTVSQGLIWARLDLDLGWI
jgi:hypothetical protein